jgi:hypothetical protein
MMTCARFLPVCGLDMSMADCDENALFFERETREKVAEGTKESM